MIYIIQSAIPEPYPFIFKRKITEVNTKGSQVTPPNLYTKMLQVFHF